MRSSDQMWVLRDPLKGEETRDDQMEASRRTAEGRRGLGATRRGLGGLAEGRRRCRATRRGPVRTAEGRLPAERPDAGPVSTPKGDCGRISKAGSHCVLRRPDVGRKAR